MSLPSAGFVPPDPSRPAALPALRLCVLSLPFAAGSIRHEVFTWLAVRGYIERRRLPLDPALRSLVSARIAQLRHREFCIDITRQDSRRGAGCDKPLARSPTGAAVRRSAKSAWRWSALEVATPDAAGGGCRCPA